MKIDILSDLHINAHLKYLDPSDNIVSRLWNRLEPQGDILIIAGDIGEITQQNVNILNRLKKLYYKEIVCVLGNHDLHGLNHRVIYLWDDDKELIAQNGWSDFRQKRDEAKRLYSAAGIHLLDGNVVEIDGVRIGGTMGWYDGQYARHHNISLGKHPMFRYRGYHNLQELWDACMPDKDIKPMRRFNELITEEKDKIDKIVESCDIMITHVNPSLKKEHQHPHYKDDPSCSFYSFDGEESLKRFNGEYWIFGHSHFRSEHRICNDDKKEFIMMSNTLGYPTENPRELPKIVTIKL